MKLSLSAKPSVFTPEMLKILEDWYSGIFMRKKKITKKQTQLLLSIGELLPKARTKKMYRLTMRKVEDQYNKSGWTGKTYTAKKMVGRAVSFTDTLKGAEQFFHDNFNFDRARSNYVGLIISCRVPAEYQHLNTDKLVAALKTDKQKELIHYLKQYMNQHETVCLFPEPVVVKIEKVLIPRKN